MPSVPPDNEFPRPAAVVSLLDHAIVAGEWPLTRANSFDRWDEIARQQAVYDAAVAAAECLRDILCRLAERSRLCSRHVRCDQEDWTGIIGDALDDMIGDTFACLPEAVARARREAVADNDRT